jgi:hypothetical protein
MLNMSEKISSTPSQSQSQSQKPLNESSDETPRSLEEQKTRLWAMSFESTKQIVHCQKCGATNIVNRLTETASPVPTLRVDATPAPVQQPDSHIEPGQQDGAASHKLTREKKAIVGLAALSAGLAVALAASLVGKKRG